MELTDAGNVAKDKGKDQRVADTPQKKDGSRQEILKERG